MDDLNLGRYVPGFVGAALASLIGHHRKRPVECLIGFGTGFAAAVFLTPPILHWLSWNPETYSGGVGFVLGFFGMSIADALMRVIKAVDWDSVKTMLPGGRK